MKTQISRLAAIAAGNTRYFTGKPCCHGHVAERSTLNHMCVACSAMKDKERSATEEGRARRREANKRWYSANHVAAKETNRRAFWRRAGMPEPTRQRPSVCELCGRAPRGRGKLLALDHCHASGEFRGWLCDSCNRGLGFLGDTLEAARLAVAYLERFECGVTHDRDVNAAKNIARLRCQPPSAGTRRDSP